MRMLSEEKKSEYRLHIMIKKFFLKPNKLEEKS